MLSNSKHIKVLGHLGALITVICWGSSFVCSKVLMEEGGFTPVETYVYRFIAAYILLLLLTFKKIFSNNWKDELLLALCGACAGSIYFILENYALKHTATGNVSLLTSISPLTTTLLICLLYKTRIKKGDIIGSILAVIGVACVILSGGEGFDIRPLGDLLALSAAIAWSIYAVAIKRVIPFYTSLFITRKLFFYGVVTALPLLFLQDAPLHLNVLFDMAQPHILMNFLFLVLMCSCFGYLIWNEAMKILGPVATNNYIYLQPVATMIIAYFVFSEEIHLLGMIGCVLILGGLFIADKLK